MTPRYRKELKYRKVKPGIYETKIDKHPLQLVKNSISGNWYAFDPITGAKSASTKTLTQLKKCVQHGELMMTLPLFSLMEWQQ